MKLSIILTLLSMMILYSNAIDIVKDQSLIQTTCKNTPHYQLCMDTLRSDPRSSAADVTGLSLITVAAVKAKTKLALSIIDKLLKNGDARVIPALQKCSHVYKTVVKYDVPEAVEGLTKGNPKFAENGMADTVIEADVCEGSFGRLGVKSPLTAENTAVHDCAEVARAVIRNLL